MIYLTVEQIISLHHQIIRQTGGMDGIRDSTALSSAVAAPFQTFQKKELFPSDIEKIARISYGLVINHAFVDGNKRIGALVMQILLQENGYQIALQKYELSDTFISVASDHIGYPDFMKWMRERIRNH